MGSYVLEFNICAILLVSIILISNITRGLYKGRSNHLFIVLLILSLFAAVSGFLAAYGTENYAKTETNRTLIYIYNYIYFFSHDNIIIVYYLYAFSSIGIWKQTKKTRISRTCFMLGMTLMNLLIFSNIIFGQTFTIDADLIYHRGPLLYLTYVMTIFSFICGIYILSRFKGVVSKTKYIMLQSMIPINLIGVGIQLIWPKMLIELFFLSAQIAVFVMVVQYHDETYDVVTKAKTYGEEIDKLKHMKELGIENTTVFVKVSNINSISMYLGRDGFNKYLFETAEYIRMMQRSYCVKGELYYLNSETFAFISSEKDGERMEHFADSIYGHLRVGGGESELDMMAEVCVCIVSCPRDISSYDDYINFAATFDQFVATNLGVVRYKDFLDNKRFVLNNNLEHIIKNCIKNNKIEVYYQPVYSIKDGVFDSAEALVRIKDDDIGIIAPDTFLGIAEKKGDIHAIGDFVLENVCRFLAGSDIKKYGLKNIHINLSAPQCVETNMVEKIIGTIQRYGISTDELCFELNESAADFAPDIVDNNISRLHEKGIHFALDNYGIGYSNTKRVIDLPFDIVKLDKDFVSDYDDEGNNIIISDTIKMLRSIGAEVVVSGIENKKIADYFIGEDRIDRENIRSAQGFYLCKPLSEADFINFLKAHNEVRYC